MNKLLAIAFSDLHIHNWPDINGNNDRLKLSLQPLKKVSVIAKKYRVPLLFAGDLFHNPKHIDNLALSETFKALTEYVEGKKVPLIGISGNHDMCFRNTPNNISPDYLSTLSLVFPQITCVNWKCYRYRDMVIGGIPYINNNLGYVEVLEKIKKEFKKYPSSLTRILLIHTDLPGAVDGFGSSLESYGEIPKRFSKLFKGIDWVLCGHIHRPQLLGKKVIMLGAPYQQTRGDRNQAMGYWKIYRDKKPKFIPLRDMPEFKEIPKGTALPDNFHYYDEITEELYTEKDKEDLKIKHTVLKHKVVKRYLKHSGVTSKKKKDYLLSVINKTNG